jgi:hypothetical protein
MTLLSTLLSFFPFSVLLLAGGAFYYLLVSPSWLGIVALLGVVYLYPVIVFHLLNLFWPLKEGRYDLRQNKYNPWWGSHQIQLIYFACPWLEALLRLIPGVYSFWLRLWGAKIGKGIYWTPNVQIDDRPLTDIGSGVIIGHKLHFISHVILPHKDKLPLYVKRICVGDHCFLGAGSRLGPGVVVENNTCLPILTEGKINQHFATGNYITGPNTGKNTPKNTENPA